MIAECLLVCRSTKIHGGDFMGKTCSITKLEHFPFKPYRIAKTNLEAVKKAKLKGHKIITNLSQGSYYTFRKNSTAFLCTDLGKPRFIRNLILNYFRHVKKTKGEKLSEPLVAKFQRECERGQMTLVFKDGNYVLEIGKLFPNTTIYNKPTSSTNGAVKHGLI